MIRQISLGDSGGGGNIHVLCTKQSRHPLIGVLLFVLWVMSGGARCEYWRLNWKKIKMATVPRRSHTIPKNVIQVHHSPWRPLPNISIATVPW